MSNNSEMNIQDSNDLNNYIFSNIEFTSQELMLLKSLNIFYEDTKIYNLLHSIINGYNFISRRTIEYFVTNYSLNEKSNYIIKEKGFKIKFNVHTSYKDQLKAYKKKYFDPFGRGIRIPFFSKDNCIITTIGQLNFYKWFFSKKIYDYLLENYDIVQKSLLTNSSKSKSYVKKKKIEFYNKKPFEGNNSNLIVSFDI